MRILILNWRCPFHPKAGGAEIVTYEVARRLVTNGHSVEWFSASFAGASASEDAEGVRIVRAGRQWTVHWHAFRRYRGKLLGRFDAVIDQVNTVPFFTPVWADVPAFMFIHQLAREVWWYESPFPLNALGYLLEPSYLRIYRKTPVLTVSASTEQDLRKLGFSSEITIVPEGLEPITPSAQPKESAPTFLYVGRLSPSKRIGAVVEAFSYFRSEEPGVLWLVGDGPHTYLRFLRKLATRLDVGDRVHFLGRVSNAEKHSLMTRAHALLLASVREGWGLVVTEANACGTPAVVYDVPGLRDSVKNEETGLLVRPSAVALAAAMTRIWHDEQLRRRLSATAREWSGRFSFAEMAAIFERTITTTVQGRLAAAKA